MGFGVGIDSEVNPGWPVASSRHSAPQTLCCQLTPWGHNTQPPLVVTEMRGSMSKRWLFLSRRLVLVLPPAESPLVLADALRSEPGLPACCSHTPQLVSQGRDPAQTHPPHALPQGGLTVNARHFWGAARLLESGSGWQEAQRGGGGGGGSCGEHQPCSVVRLLASPMSI